jgi:C1A family cysteine protease
VTTIKRHYGHRSDAPDTRDFQLHLPQLSVLPASVDLRNLLSPGRLDQGHLGSCTANALVNHRRFLRVNVEHKPYDERSRLYLYARERVLEGTLGQDPGAQLRDGMRVLQQYGVCPESDWPYDITTFAQAPTPHEDADAADYRIASYHRLASVLDIQTTLAHGMTCVIGIPVYRGFESQRTATTGVVPMPPSGAQPIAGHAIHVVGYERIRRTSYAIIENSWGDGWGDHGFGYVPLSYLDKFGFDAWVAAVA